MRAAGRSRKKKTCTAWRRPTRPSRITVGKGLGIDVSEAVATRAGDKRAVSGTMVRAFKLEDTRNIGIIAHRQRRLSPAAERHHAYTRGAAYERSADEGTAHRGLKR